MRPPDSLWADLGGAHVHWVDFGGPSRPAAVLVCVHGLGGSTVNWEDLAPLLTDRYRVVALDLVGFGLTEPGPRAADLDANGELLGAFVEHVRGTPELPVVVVGNSMGGLIAARYAVRAGAAVVGVALLDPALPHAGRLPGATAIAGLGLYGLAPVSRTVALARRRLRTPEQLVADTLALCLGERGRISPTLRQRHVELAGVRAARSELDHLFGQAAQAVVTTTASRRLVDATYAALGCPVLLVHGTHDRLVPYAAAVRMARRHPSWRFVTGRGVGHVPQIEHPAWLAEVLRRWLATVGVA